MSFFNHNAKEIHCKIVYYGPSLGGKTTNLQWVYQHTAQEQKSKLVALNTDIERTLFFDFLPLNIGEIRGYKTRFHLYTVPGQVVYDASRKLILKGLDGVVFVADSQAERMDENLESLRNLERNLESQGYDIREIPLVIQYNKRDLPNAASLKELRTQLNRYNSPEFEATASEGKGVIDSLKTVSKSIINVLKGGNTI
ncbi:MAG: gliding-motility protein MglA [Bdellovibrionaceae bacterium]|nr:gliding-motility protein MglA [Pseudobdellovibrionaceae bacterium]